MKLATTTGDFTVYKKQEDRIKHLYDAGFRYIDMDFSADNMDEFMSGNWQDRAKELRAYAENLGMKFVQAHSPCGNAFDPNQTENLVETTIRSIEMCGLLGILSTVVHQGCALGLDRAEFFEKNREFYKRLYPAMEKSGVNVLIENSTKANMGEMYFCNDGRDMKEFLEYANHPLLHACWDTGHANVEGHQYGDIMALGKDLLAVHIHDNKGRMDEHMDLFLGTISMDEVMCGLIDSGYSGYFTFESDSVLCSDNWLSRRKVFEKSSKLAEPPRFMFDRMESLKFEIGKYILETYNCYEE